MKCLSFVCIANIVKDNMRPSTDTYEHKYIHVNMKTHTNIAITHLNSVEACICLQNETSTETIHTDSLAYILCVTRIHNVWSSATNEFESFLFSFHAGSFSVIKWTLFCFVLSLSPFLFLFLYVCLLWISIFISTWIRVELHSRQIWLLSDFLVY